MRNDWQTDKVGNISQINTDTYSPKESWKYVNYLDTGNITEGKITSIQRINANEKLPSRARRKVLAGDIIYSTVRPNQKHYGIIANPIHNMLVSTGFVVIRGIEKKCNSKFLYYFLTQNQIVNHLQTIAEHSTSAYPSIRPAVIESLDIDLPPLKEQKAIAHILGTLDDKIELNRQTNETLEEIARAIFKSWFVDFDPVRAKMEGKKPVGMNEETAALFPDSFEDSSLGLIPKGWEAGVIGDIANNPKRTIKPQEIDANTPYIGLEHMPRMNIALSEWGIAGNVTSNKYRFKSGEILFGKLRPYFHKVGVSPINGVSSTDILVIVPSSSEWFGYLLYTVSSVDFVSYTDANSTGTKMPRTNWKDMARYQIPLPNTKLTKYFNKFVEPAIEKIKTHIYQSQTLVELRDTLLPKLLSGELRIKDAEKFMEKAL